VAGDTTQTYLRRVESLGAAATDTRFIDDSQANMDGTLSAGLQGSRFVDATNLQSNSRDALC
jgi:hypothetical protein